MAKIFVDSKLYVATGEVEDEMTEEMKQELLSRGYPPEKLAQMGNGQTLESPTLQSIADGVERVFEDLGYVPIEGAQRRTPEDFCFQRNVVYEKPYEGKIIPISKEVAGYLVFGGTPSLDEFIGIVKTEIFVDDEELIRRVRNVHEQNSVSYIEKDK